MDNQNGIASLESDFFFKGCLYSFDKIDIYHCLDDDSRYVIGVFSYNGARKRFIKFRHRRNKDGSWGSMIGIRFEPFMEHDFSKSSVDYKMKRNSYSISVKEIYEHQLQKANAARIANGMRELVSLDFVEESYDAQRVIIGHTFQTLKTYYGPEGTEILTSDILKAHSVRHPTKLPEELLSDGSETSSDTTAVFSVVCLDCEGYDEHFVNGEVYVATQSDGDMIVVESDDGTTHRMFADRFKKV